MHYVYVLLDPDTKDVRYVGVTARLKSRKANHARMHTTSGTPLARWFDELRAAGKQPVFHVTHKIEGALSGRIARLAERMLIKVYSQKSDGHLILNIESNPRTPKKRHWSRRSKRSNTTA